LGGNQLQCGLVVAMLLMVVRSNAVVCGPGLFNSVAGVRHPNANLYHPIAGKVIGSCSMLAAGIRVRMLSETK
jgi:hypothetical protein